MPGYSQSAIAYWVGQAKDTTGTVTPYAAARSSTGGGVTWTSGQLWSETAKEWAIRATDPGNLAHSKALNQDWATSASQWKANHDTEWQNARDPQGYAYSYPGQAANAVFWSQSASYWKGQQDAWITNYNNAIASRDYWQHTVAHNDASVWDNRYNAGYSAGNTAGYNNGYNAGAASKTTSTGTGGLSGLNNRSDGNFVEIGRLVTPRAGQGHCSAWSRVSRSNGNYTGGAMAQLRLHIHGVTVIYGPDTGVPNGGDDRDMVASVDWQGGVGGSWTFAIEAAGWSGNGCAVNFSSGAMGLTVGNT